jgi:Tannase and feruloyl esterase
MALSAIANCSSQSIPFPILPGANILSVNAALTRTGYQFIPGGMYFNHPGVFASARSFCNVTVKYTPVDSKRVTSVQVWLPTGDWNGRMQAVGGSGWSAGLTELSDNAMTGAIAQGYATLATDSGLPDADPRAWALLSPGVVDMKALEHYASTSLNDLSIIGKSVVNSFYGKPANYSYWNGCSQGGRQGLMIAQKYPKAFDGIVASAPPVNWGSLMPAGFWSQTTMHQLGKYIDTCELTALTQAAIKACDPLDGVVDGYISDPDGCHFDPNTLANTTIECWGSGSRKISKEAITLAYAAWNGMKFSNQTFMHRPATHEAPMATPSIPVISNIINGLGFTLGLADNVCQANGTCVGKPFKMVDDWFKFFIRKDPSYDTSKLMVADFDRDFEQSFREYTEIIGTEHLDLSGFRQSGSKLMSYHGLVRFTLVTFNLNSY